jgi:uncharacterized protein YbjT (DUF2867 family)
MNPNLLLTGATGRLGQLVAQSLNAQGIAWRAFARRSDAAKQLGAAEVVQGDFSNASQLDAAMRGMDCVVMISGDAPDQDTLELIVVAAAKRAKVSRVVKLSAQSAGLNPPVSFGKKHIVVERALQESGLDWTFLRPVFFQQSFLLFADTVRKGNKIILPAGKGAVAFVDARDVADCIVQAATGTGHSKKIYTLTGSESITFAQAAHAIGQARGKPVSYIAPPAFIAKIVLPAASGMPRWLAMEVIALLQAISKGDQADTTSDVRHILGREPRLFKSFTQENAAAFRA